MKGLRSRVVAMAAALLALAAFGSAAPPVRADHGAPPLPTMLRADEFWTPGGTYVFIAAQSNADGSAIVCVNAWKNPDRAAPGKRAGQTSGCSVGPIEYHFDGDAWVASVSARFPARYDEWLGTDAPNPPERSTTVRITASWTGTSPTTVNPQVRVGSCYVMPLICGGPGLMVQRSGVVSARLRIGGLDIGVRTPSGLPGVMAIGDEYLIS